MLKPKNNNYYVYVTIEICFIINKQNCSEDDSDRTNFHVLNIHVSQATINNMLSKSNSIRNKEYFNERILFGST